MSSHAPLAPSGADRWFNCTASPRLEVNLPDQESIYAAEGTVAHDIADGILRGLAPQFGPRMQGKFEIVVDREMQDHAYEYVNFCQSIAEDPGTTHWFSELAFKDILTDKIDPNCWGTLDFGAVTQDGSAIHIVDLKFGVGIQVSPWWNKQLMIYAIQFYRYMAETGVDMSEVRIFDITIVQPRGWEDPVKTWSITLDDLQLWADEHLLPAIERTYDADTVARGGDWCRFCKAKLFCPELQGAFNEMATLVKDGFNPMELETWELLEWLTRAEGVKILCNAIATEEINRAAKGEEIPGRKLIEKFGFRVWKEGAKDHLTKILGGHALTEQELKSPAQIDKVDGGKKETAKWAYKPRTGLTMADESAKGVAVTAKTAQDSFAEYID